HTRGNNMTVTDERRSAGGAAIRQTSAEENPFKPVKVLAAVGVLALVVEAWVIGRWLTGPNFKQTPIGPSAVPTYMKVGLTGLTAIGLVAWFIVWDLFWELTFIRIGYWTYPTTPHWLTVFGGNWYRIHLTEPMAWGTTWAAFALLRYFKDDKGRTIAERGVEQLRTSTRN